MNNNLSIQALVLKNKEQLIEMINEATEFLSFAEEGEMNSAFDQIEQVVYVLRNCRYEGNEEA